MVGLRLIPKNQMQHPSERFSRKKRRLMRCFSVRKNIQFTIPAKGCYYALFRYPVFKVQLAVPVLRHNLDAYSASAWRRPTLPGPCGPSTIGAEGLNGRVRDGYAWFPFAIATKRMLLERGCSFKTDNERAVVSDLQRDRVYP